MTKAMVGVIAYGIYIECNELNLNSYVVESEKANDFLAILWQDWATDILV